MVIETRLEKPQKKEFGRVEQGIDGRRHPNSVRHLVQTSTGYKLLHMGRACGNIEPEFSKHYALLRTDASFHVAIRENDAVAIKSGSRQMDHLQL